LRIGVFEIKIDVFFAGRKKEKKNENNVEIKKM